MPNEVATTAPIAIRTLRTISEHLPLDFPQSLGEIHYLFRLERWGKGECFIQKPLIFEDLAGAAGED
jgi:hypothetical protein